MHSAGTTRFWPALRETAFSWSVGLAVLLVAGALAISEFAIEPLMRSPVNATHGWDGHSVFHFFQGVLIGALVIVAPLWLLVRRNAQLRAAQRELTLTAEGASSAFYTWDIRRRRARGWGKLRARFAMPTDEPEFDPDDWIGLVHPDDIDIYRAALRDHFKGQTKQLLVDYRVRCSEGGYLWVREKSEALRDANGHAVTLAGTIEEVTELKEAERALRESEARATLALLASNSRIWQWDIAAGTAYRTARCAEILGIREDEVSGPAGWWLDQIHPDDLEGYKAAIRAHIKGETDRFEAEYRVCRSDGAHRWVLDRGLALRNDDGRAYRMAGAMEDITDKKATEEELRQTQATLRAFFENAPIDMAVKGADGHYLLLNRTASRRFGIAPRDAVGKVPTDFMPPAVAGHIAEHDRRMLETGHPVFNESTHVMPDGRKVEIRHVRFPITGDDGTPFGIGSIAQDVTEARTAEREIRNQREQLRAMADALPAMIVYITRDHRIGFINRTAELWLGRAKEDVVGRHIREVPGEEHYREFIGHVEKVFAGEAQALEVEMACADGKTRRIDRRYVPHRDAAGNVIGVYGMSIDVTDQHAVADRLRQSQKMEAVGNLTGGIAHDFNNLMFAVEGNLEFLQEELAGSADDQCLRFVRNARKGISRAADLTARLLAFSRRQTLRPEPVDIVALFDEFQELLRRTLPENIEIHAEVDIGRGRVLVDAGQLESSLLNLAINARDAMPDGGDLTFRIDRVAVEEGSDPSQAGRTPGDYIRIQVVDTGRGMATDVVGKAFEPFFTTKEIGHGTGLGLSMVHGFVEQSGGFVEIDSTPGVGTVVSLLLPIGAEAEFDDWEAKRPDAADAGVPMESSVLLVEDDSMARDVAALYLADLGYEVTTAADGAEALAQLEAGERFDLILSDVMMPNGMSGVALAEAARTLDPGQRFLLMTGYADGNLPEIGGATGDIAILQKPFTKSVLARAVVAAIEPAGGEPTPAEPVAPEAANARAASAA